MKQKLTPKNLRIILFVLLGLTFSAGIAGFLFVQSSLTDYASQVSEKNAQANIGDANLQALNASERYLSENEEVVEKTKNIVADSKESKYQNQIITDLNGFANSAGVTINRFDFTEQAATGEEAEAATEETPVEPESGLRTTAATVTVRTPLLYTSLLKFIQKIEQNKTKMQITNVSLTRSTDATQPVGSVDSQSFVIELYIKELL